jgi:DtxR family Mn-dependent transcriptional regulator
MSVTQGTVTSMMKQIEEQGLLKYFPRQGLELTAKGKTLGLRMIRRHRLIETFLVDKLDYDWGGCPRRGRGPGARREFKIY